MEWNLQDALRFLTKYKNEIIPVAGEELFQKAMNSQNGEDVQRVLGEFSTRLFTHISPKKGLHVLLTANNPGAYAAIKPIVSALLEDRRSPSITVMASGVARKYFEKDFGHIFFDGVWVDGSLLKSMVRLDDRHPFDVVLATVSSFNGPETVALYSGKSVFGAKKLYYMFEGWAGLGSAFSENRKNMDEIDGIFCNDEFSKRVVLHHLPEFPENRVLMTGTPNLDSVRGENGPELRKKGRTSLELPDDTFTVIYFGDISGDYVKQWPDIDPDINERTFSMTLRAVTRLALRNPSRNFALLFRPHPRDPRKEEMINLAGEATPWNLVIRNASNPISVAEAVHASDVVTSIVSTENFLAPIRGKCAVFLGYADGGLGGDVLKKLYGDCLQGIGGGPVSIAASHEELSVTLERLAKSALSDETPAASAGNAAKRILDIILS